MLIILLILCLTLAAPAQTTARIALQEKGSSVTLDADAWSLKTTKGSQVLRKGSGPITFRPGEPQKDVLFVPKNGIFYWNGKGYRGYVRVLERDGKMLAITHVGLEEYLAGVIGGEIPADWPAATQRALAVAARTYAVYLLSDPRDAEFDLVATDQDQVYAGLNGESSASRNALAATRGLVLRGEDGRVLKAYFSSNCGGHTSDSEPVFGTKVPHIGGVDDPYCPPANWSATFSFDTIKTRYAKDGKPLGKITSVTITGYDPSGRMVDVIVKDDQGHEYREKSQDFRRIMGYRELRSTKCKMTQDGRTLHFRGNGWGHGVGLCQWGALTMGENGMSFQEILRHYYRQATLGPV